MQGRSGIENKKRIVVKVGTSTLTYDTGKLNYHRIDHLVMQLADLVNQGKEVVLVTSGAVGAGLAPLGFKEKPATIREKQAAAAVGQGLLLNIYEKFFREYGKTVGQILLTKADSIHRKNFINSRNTLLTLLEMGVIPIINENDAVAIDELKIGDNDTLSAMVSSLVDADLLIILSDVEGVYTKNPQKYADAELISEIEEIDEHLYQIAGGAGTSRGTGGMYTKIQAASIATSAGVDMIIASGSMPQVLLQICEGKPVGTHFKAKDIRPHMKKRWLAAGTRISGTISVDMGCKKALLEKGSSLLPVGIVHVDGNFEEGDIVSVRCGDLEIAKGIVGYDSQTLSRIQGLKTPAVMETLGSDYTYEEAIHRDHMTILV